MTSRVDEKNELASLNDRFAVYIDRVRHLKADNERLTKVSSELEETVRREVSGVKGIYDRELADARRLLDQLAQEKAKYQLEVSKLQSQVEDLKAKYDMSFFAMPGYRVQSPMSATLLQNTPPHGCSGARTQLRAFPANIFEPEKMLR